MSSDDEQDLPYFPDLPNFNLRRWNIGNFDRHVMRPVESENPEENETVKSFYDRIFAMKQECLERGMTEENYNDIVNVLRSRETASWFQSHFIPDDCKDPQTLDDVDLTSYAEIVMELHLGHEKDQYEDYLYEELEDITIVLHDTYAKNRHLKYLSYVHLVQIYRGFRDQGPIETNDEDLRMTEDWHNPHILIPTFSGYFEFMLSNFLPFIEAEIWELWEINTQEEHECNVSYPQWLPREMTEDVLRLLYC